MFENLIFNNDAEKTEFEKYIKLKGECLYRQVYDILYEANNGSVTYYELSSIIRYDKNLRNKLYIYLATAEEYLKAQFLDKYDTKIKIPKYIRKDTLPELETNLFCRLNNTQSTLYYKFNIDFQYLIELCTSKNIIEISSIDIDNLNTLRNHTMHHTMLLFGQAHDLKKAREHFRALERQLNSFIKLLPEEYRNGFFSDIDKINGTNEIRYLNKFYLEITNVGVHIKENN